MVIRYETWIKGKELIESGSGSLSVLLESLNLEAPGLGVLLDFASRVLGWALGKIWDALPHENEAHSETQGWLPIHKPGKIFTVQDPRWVVKNKSNYEELLKKAHDAGINTDDDPSIPKPIRPVRPITDPLAGIIPDFDFTQPIPIPVTRVILVDYPKWVVERAKQPGRQVQPKKNTINPTFGRAGF